MYIAVKIYVIKENIFQNYEKQCKAYQISADQKVFFKVLVIKIRLSPPLVDLSFNHFRLIDFRMSGKNRDHSIPPLPAQ